MDGEKNAQDTSVVAIGKRSPKVIHVIIHYTCNNRRSDFVKLTMRNM